MKILPSISLLFLTLTLFAFPAAAEDTPAQPADTPQLKCEKGPLHKTYGNTPWLVYSCNDDHTLMIVTDKDNPAAPFYFEFTPRDDGYHLKGEGSGLKSAAADAFNDLKKLSKQDLASLLEATKTP